MDYYRYRVTYSVKGMPFDAKWDYYCHEATSAAEALKIARQKWEQEQLNPYLNRCDIKLVKFVAQRRDAF